MQDEKRWFICDHCGAMYRAEDNNCRYCGAKMQLYDRPISHPARSMPVYSSSMTVAYDRQELIPGFPTIIRMADPIFEVGDTINVGGEFLTILDRQGDLLTVQR